MTKSLPSAFLDQLIAQADPHRPQPRLNEALINAKFACGRLLAVRRSNLNLTIKQLAQMTGISAQALHNIEWGLAEPHTVAEAARKQLALKLYPQSNDYAWVGNVIALALGQASAYSEETMAGVWRDLGEIIPAPAKTNSDLPAALAHEPAPAPELTIFKELPEAFEVLRLLRLHDHSEENHIYGIWSLLDKEKSKIDMAAVGIALARLSTLGLVNMTELQPGRDPHEEPQQLYRITESGNQAYLAEQSSRNAAEPEKSPAPQPNLIPKAET